jgi:L-fuconolactonase
LTSENLESRLDYYIKNPFFKGLRHIVQAEKDDYLLRDDVQNGISKLANYNLTYDILVFPSQLNAAIALVKKFPNQQFILDHIAKPRITKSMDELWKSNIIELSKNQNVSCKLSGLGYRN